MLVLSGSQTMSVPDRKETTTMDRLSAFVAGAVVGRATAPCARRRGRKRASDPLYGLSEGQRRVALAGGQLVGNVVAGVFLIYEVYVFLFVMR